MPCWRLRRPDPLTGFSRAQVAFADGNLAQALALGQAALRALPGNAQVLQFAGVTDVQRGAPLAAESALLKSLQLAPEVALTRHVLASVYLSTCLPDSLERSNQSSSR